MKKLVDFLKAHWRYLLFPLWVFSMVVVWLLGGGRRRFFGKTPTSGTTDSSADQALAAKTAIIEDVRKRDAELADKLEKKIQKASSKQLEEYARLKDATLQEVAKWIDAIE